MSQLISSATTRRHLIEDLGWTAQHVEELFQAIGTYPRTEAEWEAPADLKFSN